MAVNWSAATVFKAEGAYFGAMAVYWSAATVFKAEGAYFGALAIYWTAALLFDARGHILGYWLYTGQTLLQTGRVDRWADGRANRRLYWLVVVLRPHNNQQLFTLQNFLMFG